jgi:ferric-dicitrate binding protein FerR (iron transport regulator)
MKKDTNIPHFDTDAAWQKLDARVQKAPHPAKIIFQVYKNRIAAAAIIAAAIAGWFLWQTNLQWHTITATTGNRAFQLPDGSSILLRKGSSVRYRNAFNKEERIVKLKGEAFFQVQPNKKFPFSITTANTETKVLGTSLLIRSLEATDEIVVTTGKVSVEGKEKTTKQLVAAGQKLVIREDQLLESTVSDSNYIAWTTGVLDFKDAPLKKVLEDVEHYYEKEIDVAVSSGLSLESIHLTARFRDQSLEQVLEEIRLMTGLEMKKDSEKIILYRK